MASNANINKVVYGSTTLIDLTSDTATAEDVAQGKTFHLASGAQAVGTASSVTPADYVTDSGTSGSWTWRKWLSGRSECWMDYDLYVSSWANWGNVYESGQAVPATTFPSGLFVATPAPNVSLRNSSTGVGIMGFETTGGAGSKTASMPLYLMRATSAGAATFYLRVEFVGRWQ